MLQSRLLVILRQSLRITMLNKLQFARVQAARWGLVAMLVVAGCVSACSWWGLVRHSSLLYTPEVLLVVR